MRYGRFITLTDRKKRTRTIRVATPGEEYHDFIVSQEFPLVLPFPLEMHHVIRTALTFISGVLKPGEGSSYDVLLALWPEHKTEINELMRLDLSATLLDAAGHLENKDEELPF